MIISKDQFKNHTIVNFDLNNFDDSDDNGLGIAVYVVIEPISKITCNVKGVFTNREAANDCWRDSKDQYGETHCIITKCKVKDIYK